MLAAVKACGPGSVLSHVPGAMLLGILGRDEDLYPEVTVVGDRRLSIPRIRVHRTAELHPRDRWVRHGIPVTSPARLLLDLAARTTGKPLRSLVRRAQGNGLVNVRRILETIERFEPRRGSRRLRDLIASGPEPTKSELEDVVLDLLIAGGFEHPDVNRALRLNGQRVVPDFRWPDRRVIVEADGVPWHDDKLAREDDAVRQALLEAHGERVLRVTWAQAVGAPEQTRRRIAAAGAPRPGNRGRRG